MTRGTSSTTGLLVTATACLATLALTGTACVLYVQGSLEAASDVVLQAVGALGITVALAARTGRDPGSPGAPPVQVAADDPLPVVETEPDEPEPDPPRPGRGRT